jgi:hypothetical protein
VLKGHTVLRGTKYNSRRKWFSENHNLYCSPDIVRVMDHLNWLVYVARMGMRAAYKIAVKDL